MLPSLRGNSAATVKLKLRGIESCINEEIIVYLVLHLFFFVVLYCMMHL